MQDLSARIEALYGADMKALICAWDRQTDDEGRSFFTLRVADSVTGNVGERKFTARDLQASDHVVREFYALAGNLLSPA
jgi:hypothetical protein